MKLLARYRYRLFVSYFLYAVLLTAILTFIHLYFTDKKNDKVFEYRAKEMLVDKISLMRNFVLYGSHFTSKQQLLQQLHTSETFQAFCLDKSGNKILLPRKRGVQWETLSQSRLQRRLPDLQTIDKNEFTILPEKKIVILPLSFMQAGSKKELFMVYIPKQSLLLSCDKNNILMIAAMALAMFLLSFPFAYIVSKPLATAFEQLERKKSTLQKQIDKDVQALTKKDILLSQQSKLASIGEAIGNIAHQWKLPLTRIQLVLQNIQTLIKDSPQEDKVATMTLQAKEQIQYMRETIDIFQDFYKTDQKEVFSLKEAIHLSQKIITHSLQAKRISLSIITQNHDLKVYGRQNEFGQVFLNLIANARDELVKNKTKDPRITITVASQKSKKALVTIADNGPGIKHDDLEKIFHPNFTTKGKNGSGLGLYISKMIIEEKFYGTIEADNTQNGGAVFVITLPLVMKS